MRTFFTDVFQTSHVKIDVDVLLMTNINPSRRQLCLSGLGMFDQLQKCRILELLNSITHFLQNHVTSTQNYLYFLWT